MTDYRELAAAELAKIRDANDGLAARARTARENDEDRAEGMEATAAGTSFRLAGAYTALAALERGAVDPGQE